MTDAEVIEDSSTDTDIIAEAPADASAPTLAELGRQYGLSSSYSPEDNKLRIRIAHWMPRELYDRFQFRARGFTYGRHQEMLHCQAWTPARHDFCLEICGEVGDEETTMADRSEQRADRFVGYRTNRIADGHIAYDKADTLSGGTLGASLVIGHHHAHRAQRTATRIERSLQTAVTMWERAEYWDSRAERVIAHADWKEDAGLRARRIETIEADKRKQERAKKKCQTELAAWTLPGLTVEMARRVSRTVWLTVYRDDKTGARKTAYDVLHAEAERARLKEWRTELTDEQLAELCPSWTLEQVQEVARRVYPKTIAYLDRWINHYQLRIDYERAILAAQGASHLLEKKPRPKQLPLLNYRAPEGVMVWDYGGKLQKRPQVEMTAAQFKKIYSEQRGTRFSEDRTHRVRTAIVGSFLSPDSRYVVVFITDSKEHKRPTKEEPAAEATEEQEAA